MYRKRYIRDQRRKENIMFGKMMMANRGGDGGNGGSNRSSRSSNSNGGGTGRARGFAAMNPEEQREIARKGGEAVSRNREHMAAIGRRGGEASHGGGRGGNNRGGNNQG